jgi:nucleoside-diphosphate-sugar epimerase
MKRYLVTGGAGFIGSHIVEALVKRSSRVRVLDNFSSGKMKNLSGVAGKIEVVRGDIRSKKDCLRAARGVEVILHQAALRSVPKSLVCPAQYNEVNIQGTLNLLEAAKACKVKVLVHASSSSVYGEATRFPQKESAPPMPISPYALTKLTAEYYCRMFSHHYGLSTTSLRYFNVFGPRQALDDEYAVVIPKFIACMRKGESPPIFGTGKQSRDFCFVENVVDANVRAGNRICGKGEVFNVAGGKDYRVLDLVRILNALLQKKIKPRFLPVRPGDVFRTRADLSSSKNILGFTPRVAFPEGIKRTLEYFLAHA